MADPNESENDGVLETTQASAGTPQHPLPSESFAVLGDEPEPSAADLDDRQTAIGKTRRSGPPLPEGDDANISFSVAAADEADEPPTEVAEP